MGIFRGFTVAACEPDEMELVRVFRPATAQNAGLKMKDIDLWELNEAFASQCLYCRDALGSTTKSTTSTAAAFDWSSVRDDRLAPDGARAARTEAPQAKIRHRDDVHRWRPGRSQGCLKHYEDRVLSDAVHASE
jgi:acetyl-CoA acetyltransferase